MILTSPNDIYRWLGRGSLRRSDNLRLSGPEKAQRARVFWESVKRWRIATINDSVDGGDDAA